LRPEIFASASIGNSPLKAWNSSTDSAAESLEEQMQAQARSTPSISELAPGDRRVLNENEVANRWGVSPKTLQRWRSEGRGPKYLKLSKRVGYPLESVIDFERRVLHDSTYQHASA
jgi:predicted DNA-binding transcriptional regulator AlpA